MLTACEPLPLEKNQTQNLPAPSGGYSLRVPIEKNTTNSQYSGTGVWKVTIFDQSGAVEYKDEESTMVGYLRIYWGWDANDQVWVYNSDDGRITRWTKNSGSWAKHENQEKSEIPPHILPNYARERLTGSEPDAGINSESLRSSP